MVMALELLIVSALVAAPNAATADGAPQARVKAAIAPIYECNFGEKADADFDGWPDGWSRRRGPGYPHYLKIGIVKQPAGTGERGLRIDLDGGAAAAFSPPIAIDSRYAYLLEGVAKSEGLTHDVAYLTLSFLGSQRKVLQTFASRQTGRAAKTGRS